DGRWGGHPDFLVRRDDRPSGLGAWSYDVADTKLAKRVKAAAIGQMRVYADHLERLQGIPPETISVVTGDRQAHAHRLPPSAPPSPAPHATGPETASSAAATTE